ncbi:abc transporter, permease protein [gamma proteobacterium HdN1]|nr:abc transporter, permease protein [gamma proteobacterium HdN1]
MNATKQILGSSKQSQWTLLCKLAAQDLWFDRKVSLCIIAALVAVIAPLLLLFGLKYGIVSQLRSELLSDVRNLELRMLGNGDYDNVWVDRLRSQPLVGFTIPLTRSLNTEADLIRDPRRFVESAEIIPSAEGDPLLQASITAPELLAPTALGDVVLSASAARKLDAIVGDTLRLRVLRKRDGVDERGELTLTVKGILPESRFSRPAALVSLELLIALEDFRDGRKVSALGFDTGDETASAARHYARARIYARNLDDVAPLAEWLKSQNVEVITRAREIESVQAIDRVFSLVFSVIAWTAVIGGVASLIGAFLANIDRKRKDFALLRLLGLGKWAVGFYILIQAVLLTGFAFGIAGLAYFAGSTVFNHALGANLAEGNYVCRLELSHLVLAFALSLLAACLVSGIGGYRAIRIQPAESLREI